MSVVRRLIASLLCCLTFSCGSSSSPCEEAGREICRQACDCGEDRCTLGEQNNAGVATISMDSYKDCTDLYVVLGCMEKNSSIDYGSCSNALQSAKCVTSSEGGALLFPEECQASDK